MQQNFNLTEKTELRDDIVELLEFSAVVPPLSYRIC